MVTVGLGVEKVHGCGHNNIIVACYKAGRSLVSGRLNEVIILIIIFAVNGATH